MNASDFKPGDFVRVVTPSSMHRVGDVGRVVVVVIDGVEPVYGIHPHYSATVPVSGVLLENEKYPYVWRANRFEKITENEFKACTLEKQAAALREADRFVSDDDDDDDDLFNVEGA